MSFAAELDIVAAAFTHEYAKEAVITVAEDAIKRIVAFSPVGNPALWESAYAPPGYKGGQFRANWNVSVGTIDTGTSTNIDSSGGPTIAEGISNLSPLYTNPFQIVHIANSLPYAFPLEHGHSAQAPGPAAIVGRTYAAMLTAYDRVVV